MTAAKTGGGNYTAVSGSTGIYAITHVPASSAFAVSGSLAGSTFSSSQAVSTGASVSGVWATGFSNDGSAGSVSGVDFQQKPKVIADAVAIGGGWYSSATFGMYYAGGNGWSMPGWIYHSNFGIMYVDPALTANSIAMYDWSMQAWLTTSMSEFPSMYRWSGSPSWLYYVEWSSPPRFYNYGTGAYETN